MMNLFRLAGDMCHVLSVLVLVLRLRVSKNAIGISIKTQELYLIVFITRYVDLFTTYYSMYNSCVFMEIPMAFFDTLNRNTSTNTLKTWHTTLSCTFSSLLLLVQFWLL